MKLFKKIHTFFVDHCHLLFKSAADNHLRIQNLLKNPDGSYQLTVRFGSFTELKNYQKKVRRLTVSFSTAIAMMVVAFLVSPYILNPHRSSAANFIWTQNSWNTTKNTAAVANYPGDNNNFKDFNDSKNITITGGYPTISTPNSATTTVTNFSLSPENAINVYYDSSNNNALVLKKPNGAACTAGNCVTECNSAYSSGNYCGACGNVTTVSHTVGGTTYTYNAIAVGSQCWLDRNLGAISTNNDVSGYGWIYQWGRGNDNHQYINSTVTANGATSSTCSTAGAPGHGNYISNNGGNMDWCLPKNDNLWQGANGVNNPCPSGFHVPTLAEWSIATSNFTVKPSSMQLLVTTNRNFIGGLVAASGKYWTSTISTNDSKYVIVAANSVTTDANGFGLNRANGFSVRCIKN